MSSPEVPPGVERWLDACKRSVTGNFAEVYGPDENGNFVVIEKASNFFSMLRLRRDEDGTLDGQALEDFKLLRVWWYEEISRFLHDTALEQAGARPDKAAERKKAGCECPGPFPQVIYICHMDNTGGWGDYRDWYSTFEYWKYIGLLGDEYGGMSYGTVFYEAGFLHRKGLDLVKIFSTSRDLHAISTPEELRALIPRSDGRFLPRWMGGEKDRCTHAIM